MMAGPVRIGGGRCFCLQAHYSQKQNSEQPRATSTHDGNKQPLSYTELEGKGKMCE